MLSKNSLLTMCCFCFGLHASAPDAPVGDNEILKPVLSKSVLNSSIKSFAQSIQDKLAYKDQGLHDIVVSEFEMEEEFLDAVNQLLKPERKTYLEDNAKKELTSIKLMLEKALEGYKVAGLSFCFNLNKAFIKDTQNPQFTVSFVNVIGQQRKRTFRAEFVSYGFKYQLALKADIILIVSDDINFANTAEPIELGYGVDLSIGISYDGVLRLRQDAWYRAIPFDITYVSFKNFSGGMFIFGPTLRLTAPIGFSIVTGGTLIPVS